MNKKEHTVNGILVGIGVGAVLSPTWDEAMLLSVVEVALPVMLGALVPDIDTEFGRHRKTLHNVFVLGTFAVFPFVYGNLSYVWIGVLTHFVLDCLGSKRGIAFFYPFSTDEWNPKIGVPVESKFAGVVTVLVTVFEIAAVAALLLADTGVAW